MRQFVGNLLFVIGQIIATILFSPIAAIVAPFLGSLEKAHFINHWASFIRWWLKVCCRIDYRVTGAENLPDTPSIVISNHQSAWETIMFQHVFPPQSYLLKKALLYIPFFGWGLAANEPIAIDRSKKTQAMQQLIKQGKARLASGRWIVVFPEGTRMPIGKPGKFQVGGAYIASKTNTDIIPVAHNAGVFWSKQRPFHKNAGTVDIIIGPVIHTAGRKPREINAEAETWILEALKKLPKQA